MGNYTCSYDKELHRIVVKEYIPGCGSENSSTITKIALGKPELYDFNITYQAALNEFYKENSIINLKLREKKIEKRDSLKKELDALNKELGEE